jgi:Zn-dependent peptidase ImmA (M78 family)
VKLEVPYLTYSDIGKIARDLLQKYHSSFEIPIPIEKIIDLRMGLNIVPFPNLYRSFGLNGYLSSDRTCIFVDEHQADNYEEKYRFTLAHELAHFMLHGQCYEQLPFRSLAEYILWREAIPSEEISWFETHGDWFAEQVLVPTARLVETCEEVLRKHRDRLSRLTRIPDDFWSYASNEIAKYFEVNPPVVEIRIRRENIPAKMSTSF